MVGENWLKVAGAAIALGLGLYLIPLGMVANPDLIALSTKPLWAIIAFLKVGIALSLVSYGVISPKPALLRAGLIVAGFVLLLIPL
jgi:TRAP-type uncharacterized transport system fused permease subunit